MTQDASVDPNLVDVELYGIVYIYNPVNKAQLGLDAPAVAPPADGSGTAPTEGAPAEVAPVEAAPPAETTPPAEAAVQSTTTPPNPMAG